MSSTRPNQSYRWLSVGLMVIGLWGMVKGIGIFSSPWLDVLPFVATILFFKSWMSLAGIVQLLSIEDQIRIGFASAEDYPEVIGDKPE